MKIGIFALATWILLGGMAVDDAHAVTHKEPTCTVSNDDDGQQGRTNAISSIANAFLQDGRVNSDPKFDRLDSIVDEWSSKDCKLLDGRPKLNFLLFGFSKAFDSESNWENSLQKVRALRKARPNSAYPILAEAQFWYSYAWVARGEGYASTVKPEGWSLFRERLAIAEKVLIDNKKIASTLPNWYELMISVEGSLQRPDEVRNRTFLEGAQRYKKFLPIYIPRRNLLEPKWGGSWVAVDDFINWAVNNTKETEGQSMYALLYFGVRDNMSDGKSFFANTRVEWPKLKEGFQDLITLHPHSQWHVNNFAALACEANDKPTYIDLRKRITSDSLRISWVRTAQQLCDAKFGR